MPIRVGDRLPEGTVTEYYEKEAPGCSVGPNSSQRYSMLVEDGVVRALHVEQPGKFEVSDAETVLRNLA